MRIAATPVVPIDAASRARTGRLATVRFKIVSLWTKLETGLGRLQVAHRGKYSVERFLALHEYTQRTSSLRALLVCILTPVPALLTVLALECIPLAPPSAGAVRNHWFWVRLGLLNVAIMFVAHIYARQLMRKLVPIALWRLAMAAMVGGASFALTVALISSAWVFPLPFTFVLFSAPYVVCELGAVLLFVDVRPILNNTTVRKGSKAFSTVTSAIAALPTIYPIFNLAFRSVDGVYRLLLLCLLPFFKLGWKIALFDNLRGVEDLAPETMVFSVELFHSLYLTNCMQASGKPLTTVVIVCLDIFHAGLAIYRLHRRTTALRQVIHDQPDLLMYVRKFVDDPSQFDNRVFESIRIRGSGMDYDLTEEGTRSLACLERQAARSHVVYSPARRYTRPDKIQPEEFNTRGSDQPARGDILNQTVRLLFHCEFLVLGEYIECTIPLLYAIHLTILRQLHNGMFYGHVRTLTADSLRTTLISIFVFWALEVLSLVLLHLYLRRHFRISALHQLAFVLEQQATLVQCKIIPQMIIALQFMIAHLGADFSFRFAWFQDPNVTWWVDG